MVGRGLIRADPPQGSSCGAPFPSPVPPASTKAAQLEKSAQAGQHLEWGRVSKALKGDNSLIPMRAGLGGGVRHSERGRGVGSAEALFFS